MWIEWSDGYGNAKAGERSVRNIEQAKALADNLGLNFVNVWPKRFPQPLWKHQNEMLGSLRRNALGKLDFISAQ